MTRSNSARLPTRLLRPAPNGATFGAIGQSHPLGRAKNARRTSVRSLATVLDSLGYVRPIRLSERIVITSAFLTVTVVSYGISSSLARASHFTNWASNRLRTDGLPTADRRDLQVAETALAIA
jgi:hypothetical protein